MFQPQTANEKCQPEIDILGQDDGDPSPSSEYDDFPEITYDEELEKTLQHVEFQSQSQTQVVGEKIIDIEDIVRTVSTDAIHSEDMAINLERTADGSLETQAGSDPVVQLSPFAQFRKKGFLSVSDLVGPIWCETQYDYRLRTLPFLPPEKRPDIIKSTAGKEIVVDKVKVEGKEKILRRGEKIHKRLEREIHPEEVKVQTSTRQDVWGLRFLNMLSAVEALLTLGKCREMPIVGFLNDIMIMGIIDEIIREPIDPDPAPTTRSRSTQTSLTSFFSPTKARHQNGNSEGVESRKKTHRLYISDSKTRASDTIPRDEDAVTGKLQVMMYKEMLDTILLCSAPAATRDTGHASSSSGLSKGSSPLPSRNDFSWERMFTHLSLDPEVVFSEVFVIQSRAVVLGNGLRHGAGEARTLNEMISVWEKYVVDLGLGTPLPSGTSKGGGARVLSGTNKGKRREETQSLGRTEDRLELVYRRAEGKKKKVQKEGGTPRHKRRRKGPRNRDTQVPDASHEAKPTTIPVDESGEPPPTQEDSDVELNAAIGAGVADEDERLLQLAISESLKAQPTPVTPPIVESTGKSASPPLFLSAVSPQLLANNDTSGTREELSVSRPSTRASERQYYGDQDSGDDREDDELARAVEMSLNPDLEREEAEAHGAGEQGEEVSVKTTLSQRSVQACSSPISSSVCEGSAVPDTAHTSTHTSSTSQAKKTPMTSKSRNTGAGSIIGKMTFRHSPLILAAHLESVLEFWMGAREPTGVSLEQTSRCGWCEFEQGCEWRAKKAEEIWKSRQTQSRS
ncbi:hypothetical protein I316_05481 [Kwoniella heveanensis BCC8398]|uniref:Exonuclease V n=1 Tax=Kwoniella heveanensis BCC8398 TaxID=1296120 RepID=A0A1B9GPV1_9TREE|nr:hypothetical protein I316_05481 [Kwoniella heveanensis BCC8398]